jgi:hypothetical protein
MTSKVIHSSGDSNEVDVENLLAVLRQISLILDPEGDGLKYTVARSLNSNDCGALARLLDCVEPGDRLLKYEEESALSVGVDSYKMPKFD